jgi:hypothetical protein
VDGVLVEKRSPQVTSNPVLGIESLNSDILGTNSIYRALATWSGFPAVTVSQGWAVCTKQVSAVTFSLPKTCKPIPGQSSESLRLFAYFKGKFIVATEVGANGVGKPLTVISASSGRIQ